MIQFATHDLSYLLETYGYVVVLLFVAIESTGIPLPGESILVAAAIYAGTTHHLAIVWVIVAAANGAILGDPLWPRRLSPGRQRPPADRYSREDQYCAGYGHHRDLPALGVTQ
jgi:hypothetical protein